VRFSTPEQAKGDSQRRQTEDTEKWCERNGIPLDTTLTDKGRSGYHGKHRDDKAALGGFLQLVRQDRVPRGSFLIVENLDRLSREDERTALRLWMDILDAGVNIVQLHPETIFRHDKSDMLDMMRAIIELSRGHSESRMKAVRAEANWTKRYRLAREQGALLTAWLPAWMRVSEDGRPELIQDRAETVRTIFQLAASGYGQGSISKKLREDKVEAFGPTGEWSADYVRRILNDRRAVGELQPHSGPERKPSGEPIRGYYPAVVTEQEWRLARAATLARTRKRPGRLGDGNGVANLFGGLLRNARDGGTYIAAPRMDSGSPVRVLMASSFYDGKGPCHSFPLDTFERCLLDGLSEVKPADVLPKDTTPGSATVLQSELSWVRERKELLQAELLGSKDELKTVVKTIGQLEDRETELLAALDQVEEQTVKPLSASWRDIKSLADLLDSADDPADLRIRLRAAVRRVVEEIWVLVVRRGRDQLASVQVFFRTDNRDETQAQNNYRSYFMFHRPGRGNQRVKIPSRFGYLALAQPEALAHGIPFELHDLRRRHSNKDGLGADAVLSCLENYPKHLIDALLEL
jgi:DNA invertase Pin-like site-specific DNA recombinase